MLTGENGILTQAQKAKTETENAAKQEEMDLAELEAAITGKDVPIVQVDDKNPGQLEQENDTTFVINSIEDLVFFSYDVTNGTTYEGKIVKLGTNLDFSSDKSYVNPNRTDFDKYGYNGPLKQALITGTGFSPIGSQDLTNSFYGTFDGDNKAICSLYENINKDDVARGGLFVATYGEIRNLGLVNVNITAIAQGKNSASGGGIVGRSYNKIINSYVTGNIETEGSSWMPVGGICGVLVSNNSSIENCYNLADIECKNIQEEYGNSNIACGGILGQSENGGTINKCFNQGKIIADGGFNPTYVGGICGEFYGGNTGIIKNSYNNAKIECTSKSNIRVGGITGDIGYSGQNLKIENCYNSGEIIGNAEDGKISGIVGLIYNNSEINNVFNIGKITVRNGNYDYNDSTGAGGIIGVAEYGANNTKINYAYNTGVIELDNTPNQRIGSIIGNRNRVIALNNCYYLKGSYDVGVGYGDDTGITAIDSIEDFPSVLSVVNREGEFKEDTKGINNGYPILEWQ